jgi:sortase (surface protein transpeptidase)
VSTSKNIYTYSVREQVVVRSSDSGIVDPTRTSQLTLLTCTGWDGDLHRYINRRAVVADLVGVRPLVANSVEAGRQAR